MTCCRVPRKQATTKTEHSLLIPKSFYSCDLKEMKFHETNLYVYNIGLALGPTQNDTQSPDGQTFGQKKRLIIIHFLLPIKSDED